MHRLALHPLMRSLGPAAVAQLSASIRSVVLAAGERLFEEGDPGDSLCLVLEGRMEVRVREGLGSRSVALLGPGDIVGELALLTGQPRTGSVVAIEASLVGQLTRQALGALQADEPAVAAALLENLLPRARRTELGRALATLLGGVEPATLHELADATVWQDLAPGERLFAQGDSSDAMFVVIHGRLRATVSDGRATRSIGEIAAGGCVGELGLLADDSRAATITAIRPTAVARLDRTAFDSLVARHPAAIVPLARWIARRARATIASSGASALASASGSAAASSIVLLPVGPEANAAGLARALLPLLAARRSTLVLDPTDFDQGTCQPGAADTPLDSAAEPGLRAWLTERERWYETIVYVADPDLPHWTRRCLRQADRVLLVATPASQREPGIPEALLAQVAPFAPLDLVLIHPQATSLPTGTASWFQGRSIDEVHHLRDGTPSHLERMARRLVREARGVVLGGGGARGLSHVGVLEVCDEVDLSFDLVGGASMGSLVGALLALGRSGLEIRSILAQVSSRRRLLDYTLPLVAFTRSEALNRVLRGLFGEVQIEDLWLPFFCVATNVTRSEPAIHTRGLVWRAVRSSLSVPALFPPIVWNGDVLVDGGIMNNLPLDLMRERCGAGPLLAVEVSAVNQKEIANFADSHSGWGLFWSRLFGARRSGVPSLVGTVLRTIVVNSEHYIQRHGLFRLADLVIEPDIQRFGLLAFDDHALLMEEGRRAALPHRETLGAWVHVSPSTRN